MFERRAQGPLPRFRRVILLLAVCCLILPTIARGQVAIKVNDNINFKIGTLIQAWADDAQDAATRGYAKNLFLRRMRFLVGGQISPNISFFYETDNPNLGKAPKNLGGGFITQDAFIEWKPQNNTFMLDAGLLLPPLCRNCVESAGALLSLDYGSYSFTESAPTQSSVGRDTGVLAKGYLADGHFEYRAGVFQGFRQPASTGKPISGNAPRLTGRVMYNVWDTESGYTYAGYYLGNKRVLSFGVGADHQSRYKAYSADGFISLPTAGKNAFNGELTLLRFDGGTFFTAIPQQNDGTAQIGYYVAQAKVMPWARAERQSFKPAANKGATNNRQQVGLTWFPNANNFNLKFAYSRVSPRVGNKTNEYTAQMQFFYY